MPSKFLNLIESTTQRMTNGGILVGDRVELVSGYKSKDSFKALPETVQKYISDMFENSDLNKKVINIKTDMPSRAPGNADNRGTAFSADVAVELTVGLYDNQNAVTIPLDLLEVPADFHNSLEFGRSKVPDSVRYDNKVQIEPKEIDGEELTPENGVNPRMTQQGDSLKVADLYLPKKNTSIPSKPVQNPQPGPIDVGDTSVYMGGSPIGG